MGNARFYSPELASSTVRLSESESLHSHRSRRLSVGDEVVLFDGCGQEAAGRIVATGRQGVEVSVDGVVSRPRQQPGLTLAVAMPKGPRQDVLIEKCTELGVRALQPLDTQRSVAEATPNRLQKWQRTAIEAAKQSGQCWIPEFREPKVLEDLLADFKAFDRIWLAVPDGGRVQIARNVNSLLAIVGPEGGWTDEEIVLLRGAGAEAVSLGPNILRIETAAIALAALVHAVADQNLPSRV